MPYDPDGDPADFDPDNPDDIASYLDHPNTQALHADLGRAFRALPAEQQIADLTPQALAAMLRRNEVAGLLAQPETDPAVRAAWRTLYDACADEVRAISARITELGGTPPEDPGHPPIPVN